MSEAAGQKLSREEIERRLLALNSPEKCTIFAGRCALRALPYLVSESGQLSFATNKEKHTQAVITAVFCSFGFSVRAARAAAAADAAAVYAAYAAAYAAAAAAYAAAADAAADAAAAADDAADAYAVAVAVAVADVTTDLEKLGQGIDLRLTPLWDTPETEWLERWQVFLRVISEFAPELPELLSGLVAGRPDEGGIRVWAERWYAEYQAAEQQTEQNAQKGFTASAVEDERVEAPAAEESPAESSSSPTQAAPPAIPRTTDDLKNIAAETVARVDCLNRGAMTEALLRLLTEREGNQPFALALFGHWGAGKSSLLAQLQDKIKAAPEHRDRLIIAEFNAWKNEKASNLGAMLAQAVVDALVKDLGFLGKVKLAARFSAKKHIGLKKEKLNWLQRYLPLFWFSLPLILSIGVCVVLLRWIPETEFWKTSALGKFIAAEGLWLSGGVAGLIALKTYLQEFWQKQLSGLFKSIGIDKPSALLKLPSYAEHRGLLGEIQKTLSHLCELRLKGTAGKDDKHLVLLVDDLDRCAVNAVKDVLDAVRLVADIPRLTTIVAVDERMAFAAVEKHYDQFGHAGRAPALVAREYLAKVLQASIRLPDQETPEAIANFVTSNLFKATQAAETKDQITVNKQVIKPDMPYEGDESNQTKQDEPPNPVGVLGGSGESNEAANAATPSDTTANAASGETPAAPEIPPVAPSTAIAATPMPLPLHEEKQLFCELVHLYRFSNPRLMGHMYLAWRLIKGMLGMQLGTVGAATGQIAYTFADIEYGLRWLFWREFCLQQEHKLRDGIEKWMRDLGKQSTQPTAEKLTIAQVPFPDDFLPQLWQMHQDKKWVAQIPLLDAVLLPPAPKMPEKDKAGK